MSAKLKPFKYLIVHENGQLYGIDQRNKDNSRSDNFFTTTKNSPEKKTLHMDTKCCCTLMRKIQNTVDGVAKFENVVKMSEFGQTIGYKGPDLQSTNCYCLFISGRRIKQASTFAKKELGMSPSSVVDFSNYLREVCAEEILKNSQKIDGQGQIVEVDESLFTRRKNRVGRILPSTWVVGGICRETKKVFMTVVPDRSAPTLLAAIETYVEPGTLLMTDCWKGYSILDDTEKFWHETVNHQYNFVDPVTGAHTQGIECLWREAKKKNKQQCGTHRSMLESYLCEFLWRKNHENEDLFGCILNAIAKFWPIGYLSNW